MAGNSIFQKLAKDENSFTQLLCNFLSREAFRTAVLPILFPTSIISKVNSGLIRTQLVSRDCGRPDIAFEANDVCALVEVKLNPKRGMTEHQQLTGCEENDKKRYLDYLLRQNAAYKSLIFLAPSNWIHRYEVEDSLSAIMKAHPKVDARLRFWEDVLDAIKGSPDPLIYEFREVLMRQLSPINLSPKEILALHTEDFPTAMRGVRKLHIIIDNLEETAKKSGYLKTSWEKKDPQSYGFYAELGTKCSLWFGLWDVNQRAQLYYGLVPGCNDEAKAKFRKYFPNCEVVETDTGENWELMPVSDDVLSDKDPVGQIRKVFSTLRQALAPEFERTA